jgi:rRNA maturation endonuclease Nob1
MTLIIGIFIGIILMLIKQSLDAWMTRCSACGTEFKYHGWEEKAYCPNKECPEKLI